MAVGTDQRVWVGDAILQQRHLRQILQVDLVHDAGSGRHDPKILERLLAPFGELITLIVATEFRRQVLLVGIFGAIEIHLHRVIDHHIDRHEWINLGWVHPQTSQRAAHGGQVD